MQRHPGHDQVLRGMGGRIPYVRRRGGVLKPFPMPNNRRGGRPLGELRPVEVTPGFHKLSEGSALYRAGGTLVLATASIEDAVPEFMSGRGKGWVTAEYQMHPRSNPKRRES